MKLKMVFFGLFLFAFTGIVTAQTATLGVTDRQINQQKRIHHGVANGELTKGETVALQKQQKRINQGKKVAKSDGVVTWKERAVLHGRQNKASKNVARKKHNKRDRN